MGQYAVFHVLAGVLGVLQALRHVVELLQLLFDHTEIFCTFAEELIVFQCLDDQYQKDYRLDRGS